MICLAVRLLRVCSLWTLPKPEIIYIESFARVSSLSVSGCIIKFFADRFIVQWPELLPISPKNAECHLLV